MTLEEAVLAPLREAEGKKMVEIYNYVTSIREGARGKRPFRRVSLGEVRALVFRLQNDGHIRGVDEEGLTLYFITRQGMARRQTIAA